MIYLDNAATTQLHPDVLTSMLPYLTTNYGNPSSSYRMGQIAKNAIQTARKQVATYIGAKENEIYFTSGGTESNNWVLTSICKMYSGKHIITSSIEHHAILHTCEYLEKCGYTITYLPVDKDGLVSPLDVKKAICKDTVLISIMTANNEIGTLQPIQEIGKISNENNILFHTDAVQALGNIPIDVQELNVDLLSLSAHKVYGPKGVGALYIKQGTRIQNLLFGGAQEKNMRAGTENVAGIVGMGKAITLLKDKSTKQIEEMRNKLWLGLIKAYPDLILNGHKTKRLPGNLNICIPNIPSNTLPVLLDMANIAVSTGSACSSGLTEPSHVLRAIGVSNSIINNVIRLSIGQFNTPDEMDITIKKIVDILQTLRKKEQTHE